MSVTRITPKQALEKIQAGVPYVDVRSQREYQEIRPAGSYNIPVSDHDPNTGMMMPNPDLVTVFAKHFEKDQEVVVGCRSGGRSLRAAEILHAAGFTAVVDMKGGMMGDPSTPGWQSEGLPTEQGDGGDHSYSALKG